MFVTDDRAGTVSSVDFRGVVGPVLASKLRSPQGLAILGEQLFVSEAAGARVQAVNLAGGGAQPVSIWEGIVQPTGLAVSENMLYVASGGQHAIFAKDLRTPDAVTVIAGTPGSAGNMKSSPCGDGGAATSARLFSPYGVAVEDSGDVYIVDSFNGRIRAVRGGVINTIAGADQSAPRGNRGKATAINIGQPRSLASTPAGLFVSTTPGLVWRLEGDEMVPIAGTWVDGYNMDEGEADEVRLNCPCGLAWWGSSLAIADCDNKRICLVDFE